MSDRREALAALAAVGIGGLPCDIEVVGRDAVDFWDKALSFDGVNDDFGVVEELTLYTPCTALVRMDTGHRHYVKTDQFSKFVPADGQTSNFLRNDDGGCISEGGELHREVMTVCAAKRKAATLIGCKGFHFKGTYTTEPVEVIFKNHYARSFAHDRKRSPWTSYEFKIAQERKFVLTVHVIEQDDGFISVSCTNIGGDEMAAVSVAESKTVGDLRAALAAELEDEAFEMMTPDGRLLSNGKASLEVLQ